MKAQDIMGSPAGILLGMGISLVIPAPLGYGIARCVARIMRWRRNHLFTTVRKNLERVVGPNIDAETLDRMAENVIYHAGCCYYDMFRFTRGHLRRGKALQVDQATWDYLESLLSDDRGTIMVGAHISNFDLAAQWIATHGYEIQALSLATPDSGDRMVNRLRKFRGIVVTPVSYTALRQAVRRLRNGGVVITGIDRLVSSQAPLLTFFGEPARLPTGHVRLAMQTRAHLVVAYCSLEGRGRYRLHILPEVQLERTGDRERDIVNNAQRVLEQIEQTIRSVPDQWIMFVPVWDELEGKS